MAKNRRRQPLLRPDINPTKLFHAVFLGCHAWRLTGSQLSIPIARRTIGSRWRAREIFVEYGPAGSGRSKLDLSYFEKILGVTGTARNWNTVTRLLAMLEES